MSSVHARPHGAKNPATLSSASDTLPFLRWNDPAELRSWIRVVRDTLADGLAAGADAAKHPEERVLSRAEARRKIAAADEILTGLLDLAERSLERDPTR